MTGCAAGGGCLLAGFRLVAEVWLLFARAVLLH